MFLGLLSGRLEHKIALRNRKCRQYMNNASLMQVLNKLDFIKSACYEERINGRQLGEERLEGLCRIVLMSCRCVNTERDVDLRENGKTER